MAFSETVTLLRAKHGRACKTITPEGAKDCRFPKHWFYEPVQIMGLVDFAALLSKIETDDKAAIIRGQPKQNVQAGSVVLRQKAVFESRPLRLTCFDIDKLEVPEGISPISNEAIEFAVRQFPPVFHNVSYVAQFSANAGRRAQIIKLHLWFMLRNPQADRIIRAWAKSMGGLVDEALFDSIQTHYTANPHFEGGEPDPFNGASRVRYVRKANDSADFEPPLVATAKVASEQVAVSEIVTDNEGKAIDGREALLLKIRWQILQNRNRPRTREAFFNRVWEEFREKAAIGPTAQSAKSYDYDYVVRKCAPDWEKHGKTISIPVKPKFLLSEAEALVRKGVRDAIAGGKIAIKVTPGVGKSTIAAKELAGLWGKNVEIYAPTNAQQQEWEERTGGKTILGRSPRTCRKHKEVEALQKLGISADAALCKGTLGGAGKCEHFDSCPYQAQFRDAGPGVRIYSHAHLATPRHKSFKRPHITVIDERFFTDVVEKEKFDRASLYAVAAGVSQSLKLSREEQCTTHELIATILSTLDSPDMMLDRLRDAGVGAEALRNAARLVSQVTPWLAPKVGETIHALKIRAKQNQRPSFVLVTRLFRALAREIQTNRRGAHSIMRTDEGFLFCRRRPLERLEGVESVLLLDADLERENVTPYFPDIEVREIECAQNLCVYQISDLSLSRAWLGLHNETPNGERISELCARIRPLLGSKPLHVTYKKLIPHTRKHLPAVLRSAHFGALRGTNAYEKCDSVVVSGRQFLSTTAIEVQARALHYDSDEPLTFETVTHWHAVAPDTALPSVDFVDGRLQALMVAQREAETRQAVGRLRAVRSPSIKKAFIFSNQPVAGLTPDHLIEFERSKIERIFAYLGGWLPLNPKALVKFAGGYFPKGETQALKWRDTVSLPQRTKSISIVRWGSENLALTHGRDRRARGGPKFRVLVDSLLHPHPEHSLAAKADLVVDPLPWAEVPRSALPAELKIPGFDVVCLPDRLHSTILEWAHRAALARGEHPICPPAPEPALHADHKATRTICPAGGRFALAA